MKILITAPSLNATNNVSGISSVVSNIIGYNKKHSYFHYLLGRSDHGISRFSWLFIMIFQLLYFPIFLFKNKIQLVHQNLPMNPKGILREYIINKFCRIVGIPVLLHIHGGVFLMNGTKIWIYKILSQKMFNKSKVVVVLSEFEKQALEKHYQFAFSEILYNSVDVSYYHKKNLEKVNQIPIILYLGIIEERKGIQDIIDAVKLMKNEFQFKFVLCGTGPLKDYAIQNLSNDLGECFEYMGIVKDEKKISIIEDADYFVLASRYGEGLPMALLETMAAGVVPVVTDDASIKFVVAHTMNGIICEKRNPQDIYEKFKEVILDKELYKKLSVNARNTIITQYDMPVQVEKLNRLYDTMMQ